ncbi:helix-turn-helix domain-containing protein [Halobacteriales archaeon Cl-PHB]
MRYATLKLRPPSDGIHPVGRLLAAEPAVTRERLVHVNALSNGDGILYYRLSGDADVVAAELERHDRVRSLDVYHERADQFYLYIYVTPGEPAGSLMALVDRYALILDTPIEFRDDGSLVVTVAGQQDLIQGAFKRIPDTVQWEVLRAGTYDPDTGGAAERLTSRQREVVETAVELGYYEVPRRATHEDIAEELGCATSTVDEHLRKAESSLLTSLCNVAPMP